jgi:hypothetical protein
VGSVSGDVVVRARAALDGVAEGPWMVSGGVVWREDVIAVPDPNDPTGQTPMPEQVQEKVAESSHDMARFIAAARDLVPELVDEVERLRAAVGRVRVLTEHWAESEDVAAALDGAGL